VRRALVLALVLGAAGPARAQVTAEPVNPHPDPSKFKRGLYGEAELGTMIFLGEAGQDVGPGAALGARLGYDFLPFAAVQLHAFGSTHTTRFDGTPQAGQLLQLYQGTAEARLGWRFGQVGAAVVGGAGLARLSTNLLGTAGLTAPDVKNTPVFLGALAVDYHTQSRHFAFGLTGGFSKYQKLFTTGAITATVYAHYTF
jgi:hypothetical protein